MPVGLSKADMFERIVQERKVEFAFEGQRFWDLRRWKLAEQVLNNKYFHGMVVQKDAATGKLSYNAFEINFLPKQIFPVRDYLMPIPQAEMEKNSKLVQNTGY